MVGYVYGVNSLYQVGIYASMALHTATFFVLTLAILAADERFAFARVATSDTVGGLVSRWLLPTIPIIIFVDGYARLKGEQAGYYEFQFELALMVLFSVTICVVAVAWTSIVLHRIDITRKRAESEILSLNAGLEQKVQERTQEIARISIELQTANTELERISLEDGLTGLANRRHFDVYLASQKAFARRYEKSLALVLCDVDCFKAYNDRYGHQAGDECLKSIAATLQSCCQRPADMVARYGGEEFAMILPDTDMAGANRVAEMAREAVALLRTPHDQSDVAPYVSISGGVAARIVKKGSIAPDLLAVADKFLYEVKRLGRNRIISAAAEAA